MIGECKSTKDEKYRPLGNNILVNEIVYIIRGKILGNPFSKKIYNSEATFWVINNEDIVRKTIQMKFRELGVVGGNVDDCLDLLINEFNTREDLQFNENYFGEDSGYTLRDYVLNRVKHTVTRYKSELTKQKKVYLLNSDETNTTRAGVSEESIGGKFLVEDTVINSDKKYWDDLFDKLMFYVGEFLKERLYKEFDYELVIAHLYFDVEDDGRVVNKEEHYKRVASKSGETYEVIQTIVSDMVTAVKDEDRNGNEILKIVKELMEGIKTGWKPVVLRKKYEEENDDI